MTDILSFHIGWQDCDKSRKHANIIVKHTEIERSS